MNQVITKQKYLKTMPCTMYKHCIFPRDTSRDTIQYIIIYYIKNALITHYLSSVISMSSMSGCGMTFQIITFPIRCLCQACYKPCWHTNISGMPIGIPVYQACLCTKLPTKWNTFRHHLRLPTIQILQQ